MSNLSAHEKEKKVTNKRARESPRDSIEAMVEACARIVPGVVEF
jgi:hypothetical protein